MWRLGWGDRTCVCQDAHGLFRPLRIDVLQSFHPSSKQSQHLDIFNSGYYIVFTICRISRVNIRVKGL